MTQFILMDIEGTTTSIDFVHKTLFPYASAQLPAFIRLNHHRFEVQAELASVRETAKAELQKEIELEGCIELLLQWIKEDRKHTALKALQGYLWKDGYETGQFKGHVYEDVQPCWERWREKGIRLGIYSSGSVAAQKLLFKYSEKGDLTPYIEAYFDTTTGHKREADSYSKIAAHLQLNPSEILFLSDVKEELEAAQTAGFQVLQALRPGIVPANGMNGVRNFNEIVL